MYPEFLPYPNYFWNGVGNGNVYNNLVNLTLLPTEFDNYNLNCNEYQGAGYGPGQVPVPGSIRHIIRSKLNNTNLQWFHILYTASTTSFTDSSSQQLNILGYIYYWIVIG